MKIPYQDFVLKLKKLYGAFDEENKKYEKAPNSEIARELGYSDAQFSRLINNHATEGEYARANKNADRILALIDYEERFKKISTYPTSRKSLLIRYVGLFIGGLIIGGLAAFFVLRTSDEPIETLTKYDMLKWTFESNFINPYKGLRDLPADCDYRCYKYQGKWQLKQEYKLPFLRERSGFHYLAKSVVAYIRCLPNDNPKGKLMRGFEYQEHEIWYDILERPIGSFISENGSPLESYEKLKFDEQQEFVKIGTVHSFYTNDFELDSTQIYRKGQDIGRDIEFVSIDELQKKIKNKALLEKIQTEMTLIVQDPLHDFSKPSACEPSVITSPDFHTIANGHEMSFDCEMTTAGRFPINYTKTYVLVDQFITDKCRTE